MRRALRVLASVTLVAGRVHRLLVARRHVGPLRGRRSPRDDGATAEAGADGPTSVDGAPTNDAATDTTVAADADAAPVKCVESANRFCDDFDQVNPGAKWSDSSLRRGVLTYDDGNLSPPHALHATIQAGSGNGEASLIERYPSGPSKMR